MKLFQPNFLIVLNFEIYHSDFLGNRFVEKTVKTFNDGYFESPPKSQHDAVGFNPIRLPLTPN